MNFNPKDFYIGMVEFFTILLPGTILTLFIYPRISGQFLPLWKTVSLSKSQSVDLLIILLIGYIMGHLIFAIASFIDRSYNKFSRKYFESNYDLPYLAAKKIRNSYLSTEKELDKLRNDDLISKGKYFTINEECKKKGYAPEIINTYKWSQHYLKINKPDLYSEVQRIEADSKFFRSLVIIFLIIGIWVILEYRFGAGGIFLAMMAASYYRYAEQRFKSTERAYELVVTAENLIKNNNKVYPEFEKNEVLNQQALKSVFPLKNSNEISNSNQDEITYLNRGFEDPITQIEIPPKSTYTANELVHKANTFYCSKGKGHLFYANNQNQTIKVNINPKACISIPIKSLIKIQNEDVDPMVIYTNKLFE